MTSSRASSDASGIATLEHARFDAAPVDLAACVSDALKVLGDPRELTLLINDPQRDTDSRSVLEEIAERIDPPNIRILVATGTHKFTPDAREQFRRDLTAAISPGELAWHDARGEGLVDIAGVWRGHRWLLEDAPLLAVGSCEPHYFAGFTGAHKTCTIGCASYDDIERNHFHALSPRSRPGRLSGNPVYQGILDMLSALDRFRSRPLAGVNLVQIGREITAAVAGSIAQSLQQGVAIAERVFIRRIPAPAKGLILEATGVLAESFYQADKAIKNNEWAVRDGGTLVLIAPCGKGIGQDQFLDLLRAARTYEQARRVVDERGYRLGDHKGLRLRYLTDPARRNVGIFLVSDGISPDDARTLGVTKVSSAEEGMSRAGLPSGTGNVYRIRDAADLCVLPGGGD